MKDLQPVDLNTQVQNYLTWLDTVRDKMMSIVDTNPQEVVKTIKKIELLEIGTQKAKLIEVTKKAAITKIYLMRQLGTFILKEIKRGKAVNPEMTLNILGLSRKESMIYRRLASLPKYHFDHAVDCKPTIRYLVNEYERGMKIKKLLIDNEVKNIDATLKDYLLKDVSVFLVESYLNKNKTGEEDIDYDVSDDVEEDIDTEDDTKKEKEVLQDTDISIFQNNSVEIIKYFDQFLVFIKAIKVLKREQYNLIKKQTTEIREKSREIVLEIKNLKEKIGG